MKRSIVALMGIMVAVTALAQDKIYLNEAKESTAKEEALYYRISNQFKVKEDPAKGEKHYMIMDYFLSGRIEMVGSFLSEKAEVKDGPFVYYHDNGRERERGLFQDNKRVGTWKFWSEEGQLLEERKYVAEKGLDQEYLLVNVYKVDGTHLVKDGDGDSEQYHANGQMAAKGKVIGGKKAGIWRGYYPDGKMHYVENFSGGKLVKGISYDLRGKKYDYEKYYVQAKTKKGMDGFNAYVKREMVYPTIAKQRKVEGKVLVQFTVGKKGEIINPTVVKGIGSGCDEVAVKLVATGPSWKPGLERGQEKEERVIVPVHFDMDAL